MSFYLRKTVKVGPVRFNVSKSGVGVSAGFKGFRLGAGPRGNYVHMGAGGTYYRKTLSPTKKESTQPRSGVRVAIPRLGVDQPVIAPVQMTDIESGDVSQMVHSSSAELLKELNTKKSLVQWWPFVLIASTVGLIVLMASGIHPILLLLLLFISAAGATWTYQKDVLRKTVVLLYDFDSTMEVAYGALHQAASILSKCSGRWHIASSGKVHDSRYHAGASDLVNRKDTVIGQKSPDFLKTNVATIAIEVGRQTLYFFPDRILIYDEGRIGAVGYGEIVVEVNQSRFIEDGTQPRDAYVVDHTWRYVNKSGAPDKRFSNNARLPICLYDSIHFQSASGLNEIIQVSRHDVAKQLDEAIRYLGKLSRQAGVSHSDIRNPSPAVASQTKTPSPLPSGQPTPTPIQQSAADHTHEAIPNWPHQPKATPTTPSPTPPLPRPIVDIPSRNEEVVSAIRPPKASQLQWVIPGTPVQIEDLTIHGMFYLCETELGWGNEPSAISRTSYVSQTTHTREDLPYYPSYSALTPAQRRFYLEWQAKGRRISNPDDLPTGYLFLFFYGIERRILVNGDFDPSLWFEVYELLRIYGLTRKSRSIASYFGDFLHFTSYSQGAIGYSNVIQGLLDLQGKRTSETALTLALANYHRSDKPIDWKIAHLIAMNLEDSRRSVVTERTGDAFKSMFQKRFDDLFPNGMPLKASKKEEVVRYQNGNSSIRSGYSSHPGVKVASDNSLLLKVPGVMGIKSQFKPLSSIWNQCIEDLSGYSRAISRLASSRAASNQDRLKAYLALPPEIRSSHQHPLKDEFSRLLQSCPFSDDVYFAPVSLLASILGYPERATLTQSQSEDIANLVESLSYTVGPHPMILNLPLGWSQEVAIIGCAAPAKATPLLGGLLRLLYLAVLVASADGVVDESELEIFHQHSGANDGFEKIQIRATEAALVRDTNVAAKQLQRIAKSVPVEERKTIFKLLVHIACSDEVLSSDENRLLRKIAKAFQLGDEALDDVLNEDSTFETVTVTKGKVRKEGEKIPQPASPNSPAFSLDMNRIQALTAETAEVVTILSKALAEESHDDPIAIPLAPQTAQTPVPEWLETLEPRYQAAFLEIIALPEEQAVDFTAIAARHHLMEEDLLDGINAWSDENLGDFLIYSTNGSIAIQRELLPT